MGEQKIDAIYIEPGSSMFYFTGVRWGNSERTFGVVIPARGELACLHPACVTMAASRACRSDGSSHHIAVHSETLR